MREPSGLCTGLCVVGRILSRRAMLARLGAALFGILTLALGALQAQSLESWKIGLATTRITPEKPMWMAGYGGRTKPAEGTLHDLWVKVLAIQAPDGGQAIVVSSDLLGFPRPLADTICRELLDRCKLDRARIMLTCSHTHCGPVLESALFDVYPLDDEQRALITQYSAALTRKIIDTAGQSLAALQPAALWAGEGECTFAVNRRNNTEKSLADARQRGEAPVGPMDHAVPVLACRSPDGKLLAVLFGYACHNTTLAFQEWCGDYAGFAQLALNQRFPGAQTMFYIGCGADQNPMPRRTVELCQQYGTRLADSVQQTLAAPMRSLRPKLRTAFEVIPLAMQHPTREELEASAKKKTYEARWASRLLAELDAGKSWPATYPYPVQVWRLGDEQIWIVLCGEVVVDYSLLFKQKYGPRTWIAGYANDVMSYIPSQRVREEGRYEAGAFAVYGLPAMRWTEQIEQQIAASVDRLVQKTNN